MLHLCYSHGTLPSMITHPLIMVIGRGCGCMELGVEEAES